MGNREIKFRAYIPALKMMLYNVDVYANGMIGIAESSLTDEFWKLYHVEHDDDCIRENGTYRHVININTGEEYVWFNDGDFELMQSTGLTIYEGDIVSVPYVTPLGTLTDEENYKSRVFFKNGAFCIDNYYRVAPDELSIWCKKGETKYVSNVGNVTELLDTTYLTVIGNIYEHPHLLK